MPKDRDRCTRCPYREFVTGKKEHPGKCKKLLKKKKFAKFVINSIKDSGVDKDYPIPKNCPLHSLALKRMLR